MRKVLLIIPAYNEEKNIGKVYEKCKARDALVDVLVINDGSTDRTKDVLDTCNIPHIDLVQNVGIGGAVQAGYKYAYRNGYDIAIQFDGDGQHNIEFIDALVAPIENKEADFVIGSRFLKKDMEGFKSSASRRIGIKVISALLKICTGEKITDPTSGFRAANRKVIEKFSEYYPLEYPEPESIATLIKEGFLIKECPVIMNERKEGKSSIGSWKNVYYMINVCLSIILTSLSEKGKKL